MSERTDTTFFDALPEPAQSWLASHARLLRFERGAALFHDRQPSDTVYVIRAGRVKVTRNTASGLEVVLEVRGSGELLGEQGALDGQPRTGSAVALEPVESLVLAGVDFVAFLERFPNAATHVMATLSRRLREATARRVEFAGLDATGRVAARLTELAERYGTHSDSDIAIELPITQEELAGWTGASRESVARALQSLRDAGWITTARREIRVLDLEALRRLAS